MPDTVSNFFDTLATGRASSDPFITHFTTRDPTAQDVNYPIQKRWINTTYDREWILESFSSSAGVVTAVWSQVSSGTLAVETLTGNTGGAVPPDASHNINVVGDGSYITVTGVPATNTLTISPAGGLTTLYTADTGTATPAAGNLNVFGGSGISTSASGNTITISAKGIAGTWTDEATNFSAVSNNGYFIVGNAIATLPASPANGDVVAFIVDGAFTVTVTATTGKTIKLGPVTSASAGTAANTANGDTLTLVYRSTNTQWEGYYYVGAWTVS